MPKEKTNQKVNVIYNHIAELDETLRRRELWCEVIDKCRYDCGEVTIKQERVNRNCCVGIGPFESINIIGLAKEKGWGREEESRERIKETRDGSREVES